MSLLMTIMGEIEEASEVKFPADDEERSLELPTDRPRPTAHSYRGDNMPVVLNAILSAQLRGLAEQHDMTLFMLLYAAWALLLGRLSGQEDIVIGTPIAGRRQPELQELIGIFVNTLPLRVSIGPLKVTSMLCVPSLYRAILDLSGPPDVSENSGTLTRVIVAGEACPPTLIAESARIAPERVIFNEYGPTEATVWATVCNVATEGSGLEELLSNMASLSEETVQQLVRELERGELP
jgi:non-ribosomal peptide synthetase component F